MIIYCKYCNNNKWKWVTEKRTIAIKGGERKTITTEKKVCTECHKEL